MADFETITDPGDCRVWGWGLVGIPDDWKSIELDDVQIGSELAEFIEQISVSNTVCYFHNLRFDGRFLLDWLLKNGYSHVHGNRGITPGHFTSLINDMGAFYSISVRWLNGNHTEFRDSAKKLPMSVKRIAESFKFEQGKGEIDYHKPRPVGYQITAEEREYIALDVVIVAKALGQQIRNGMQRLTVGSDALGEFKNLLGTKQFDRLFPTLSLAMDTEIRKAYRGGFTYCDPRYRGKPTGPGMVFDVNSLYPSVMYNQPIPIGEPEFVQGRVLPTASHPLTIFSVTFTAKLKPNHIPCIQVKGSVMFMGTEYQTELTEPTTLTVTNVDWALINDHYNVEVIAWENGWRFRSASGVFDNYIDKYMRIKSNSIGGIREIAKLFLNSLYGKFAVRPDVTGRIPYLDDSHTVRLRTGPFELRNPVYTAAGVFITSYARDVTIRAAQANFNAFAYADTDSLHLLSMASKGIEIHPSKLGAWKHEYNFDAAYYIRSKAYVERTASGEFHNAVAGVPTHISAALTFDDITHGTDIAISKDGTVQRSYGNPHRNVLIHGKLNPKAVPGGVVLMGVPYELVLD